MSDARLRGLERRWEESGSPEDGALYLRERLRAGESSAAAVALASYVGDPAARLASGSLEEAPPELGEFVEGLERWPREVWVRAALAAAEHVAPCWRAALRRDDPPREALSAARAWLRDPGLDHAREAARRGRVALIQGAIAYRPGLAYEARDEAYQACRAALSAARVAGGEGLGTQYAIRAARQAAEVAGDAAIRGAIREALVGWALSRINSRPQPGDRSPDGTGGRACSD